MTRITILAVRLALLAVVLAAWEVLPRMGALDARILPPLGDVLAALVDLAGRPRVGEALGVSAGEFAVAFAIAVPLGVALGVLIAESAYLGEIFKPMLFYVFSVPKSIFLPMFILAFGIGFPQKVAYAAFSTVFIVIMTATAAVALMMTMKTVENAAYATFCWKPMPKARMNIGRKIDFGTLNT